jgi:optic atrophy protein 1
LALFVITKLKNNLSLSLDPRLKSLTEAKMAEWRAWFDNRLDNAIEAAETVEQPQIESTCLKSF